MGLRVYRDESAAPRTEVRHIAPTIIVGLGGTGKEVLLRIRKRFFERYGRPSLPLVRFLWIDTDMRNIDLDGESYDFTMESVAWEEQERLDATLPGEAFNAYFQDAKSHPHIFEWLDPGFRSYGQVVDGAGQKRPMGRLAFFHHHREIGARILALKNEVQSQTAAQETAALYQQWGLPVPKIDGQRLELTLVFSVAGGTGSGMFLDAAFYFRHLLKDSRPELTAYLVLPGIFAPDVQSETGKILYANAYAALKELEHFSLAKDLLRSRDAVREQDPGRSSDHFFRVQWDKGTELEIPGPPFNTCYLVDRAPAGGGQGLQPAEKKSLCDMIAEAVFLEYSEDTFAAQKRSTRANLEQFLLGTVEMTYEEGGKTLFTDIFSCRFSAFGLTKLFIPADRIRNANAMRLAKESLAGVAPSYDAAADITQQLEQHYLRPMGLDRKAIVNAMKDRGGGGGVSLDDEVERRVERIVGRALDSLPERSADSMRELLQGIEADLYRPSDPAAPPGGYYARIKANRSTLARKILGSFDARNHPEHSILDDSDQLADASGQTRTGSIGRVVRGWLDDPRYRFSLARAYLGAARDLLKSGYRERLEKAAQVFVSQAKALSDSLRRRIDLLRAEEEDGGHLASRRALLRRIRRDAASWGKAMVGHRACLAAGAMVSEDVVPYINQLMGFLDRLEEQIRETVDRIEQRRATLRGRRENVIFEEVFSEELENESYKVRWGATQRAVDEEVKNKVIADFLEEASASGVGDLGFIFARRGTDGVIEDLQKITQNLFKDVPVRFDVLKHLLMGEDDRAEVEARLRGWATRGTVWLPEGTSVGQSGALQKSWMDAVFLGSPATTDSGAQAVLKQVEGALKGAVPPRSNIQRLSSSGPDTVYIYSEYAGVPMPYIDRIERYYSEAYLAATRDNLTVHLDWHQERFPQEIFIRSHNDVIQFVRVYRLFLVSVITRLFTAVPGKSGRLEWQFLEKDLYPPQPVYLGPEPTVLATLQAKGTLLQDLENRVELLLSGASQERRLHLFAVVVANIAPDGAFPILWRDRGGLRERVFSHGNIVLNRMAERLAREAEGSFDGGAEAFREQGFKLQKEGLEAVARRISFAGRDLWVLKDPL